MEVECEKRVGEQERRKESGEGSGKLTGWECDEKRRVFSFGVLKASLLADGWPVEIKEGAKVLRERWEGGGDVVPVTGGHLSACWFWPACRHSRSSCPVASRLTDTSVPFFLLSSTSLLFLSVTLKLKLYIGADMETTWWQLTKDFRCWPLLRFLVIWATKRPSAVSKFGNFAF